MSIPDLEQAKLPFLPYPAAIKALAALSSFRKHEAGRDRPRCLHIVAASGMGKSRLLKHYHSQINPERSSQGIKPLEVILLDIPSDACYRELARSIIDKCLPGYPHPRTPRLLFLALDALRSASVRQVLLDEAGNNFLTGRLGHQRMLGFLKSISNAGVTIALATTIQAANAVAADEQLQSRFIRINLPKWEESHELRQFIAGIEDVLPLSQRSHLDSKEFVRWFAVNRCLMTDDLIGVICKATLLAIREKSPCVSRELLERALAIHRLTGEETA